MNQKSIIVILGVVVIALLGTTVYFATINKISQPVAPAPKVVQQPAPTPTPTVEQPTAPVAQPAPTDATVNWQAYSNTQYGFSLKIPTDWKGYTTTIEARDDCTAAIGFNIPKWDGVFSVKICTKSQWTKLQKNAEYMANTQNLILGENSTYVYIFGQGAMLAGGSDGVTDDKALATQLKEVENIKKTFKLAQ